MSLLVTATVSRRHAAGSFAAYCLVAIGVWRQPIIDGGLYFTRSFVRTDTVDIDRTKDIPMID